MATQQQLKNKAAKRLGILATGQALTGPQDAILQTAYNSLYDRMLRDGRVVWAKDADIPDALLDPLSALLANKSADDFGVSDARYVRLQNAVRKAEREISSYVAPAYVPPSDPKDY